MSVIKPKEKKRGSTRVFAIILGSDWEDDEEEEEEDAMADEAMS